MSCEMSLHDFDRAVKMILDQEFLEVLEMGLVSEEALFSVMTGMRSSLREAFNTMSETEAWLNLEHLRRECRETAASIFSLTDPVHWN